MTSLLCSARLDLYTLCRYRQIDRKNYQLIEHLIRKAKRQLSMVEQKQVTGVKML